MPITITRSAKVYRLWLDADLRECFTDHAALGWICTLVASQDGRSVVWGVRMQLTGSRIPVLAASLDDVIVSDLTTVEAMTLPDYNTANPRNTITREEPS